MVIGATCEIQQNVKVYQGVTLGAKSFPRDGQGRLVRNAKRHPTVERDVVIYSNATVLGGDVTLGAGAVIGAGATITASVAAGTKVDGGKSRACATGRRGERRERRARAATVRERGDADESRRIDCRARSRAFSRVAAGCAP